MSNRFIFLLSIFFIAASMIGCASIPPEFLTSMQKEQEGITFLNKRHQQSVEDLVNNWYDERIARIDFTKQSEIQKITIKANDPNGGSSQITVIKRDELVKIEEQYKEAMDLANKIKEILISGYSDEDNWSKVKKINSVNLEMAKSLNDLNQSQRRLYSELVGQNTPFPSEFLNEEAKKLLKQ